MAVRFASIGSGSAGDPDHRAWRYFNGRAGDAKWRLRLHRETVFLGATHFGGAPSGRKETTDFGGALVEICLGGPPGNRGEPAGPIAADTGSTQACIQIGLDEC